MCILRKLLKINLMKKFMVCTLLLGVFAITACDNDDDTGGQDPFIGTWYISEYVSDGVSRSPNFCEIKSKYVVEGNKFTLFEYLSTNGSDSVDDGSSGTWVNKGNNIYEFDYGDGDTDEVLLLFENGKLIDEYDNGSDIYSTTELTSGGPVCVVCEQIVTPPATPTSSIYCDLGDGTYTVSEDDGVTFETLELPENTSYADFLNGKKANNFSCSIR